MAPAATLRCKGTPRRRIAITCQWISQQLARLEAVSSSRSPSSARQPRFCRPLDQLQALRPQGPTRSGCFGLARVEQGPTSINPTAIRLASRQTLQAGLSSGAAGLVDQASSEGPADPAARQARAGAERPFSESGCMV